MTQPSIYQAVTSEENGATRFRDGSSAHYTLMLRNVGSFGQTSERSCIRWKLPLGEMQLISGGTNQQIYIEQH